MAAVSTLLGVEGKCDKMAMINAAKRKKEEWNVKEKELAKAQ